MSVEHVWVGATTDTSAWVRGKVTGSSTRLAVDTDPAIASPVFFGPDTPTDGMVSITATGLDAGTRYYYALEDDSVLDLDFAGTFLTHPVAVGERASYIIGAAGDAGLTGAGDDSHITSAVSDNPVFDTMRSQAAAEDWLFFAHLGDLHYRDITSADPALYRAAYDDVLTFNGALAEDARQGRFYRDIALTYTWDDHDFGANNSDRTAPGNADANSVYRERVPHYGLGADGIYQSWQAGRVLYVQADCRTFRDPNTDPQLPTKTMLGSTQKTWLENLLTANTDGAEALVWISSSRWIGGADTWSSFLHERAELVQMFGDLGWLRRTIMLTADEHALGISSGPNNPHGSFPMLMLASMDSSFSTGTDDDEPIYNIGRRGGRQQYGTIAVRDDGHTIALTGTGYRDGTALMSHTKYVHVANAVWSLDGTTDNKGDIVPPFHPVLDDQGARNSITAQRTDGGEYTYTDESHAAARGVRDAGVTVNVATDDQLPGQASWRVHLGTWPGMRYSAVSPALNVRPQLAEQWLSTELGDAGIVTGLPPQHPPDPATLIGEGYTETIQPHRWDITLNTTPAGLWTVARLADSGGASTAGPNQPNRADTSGSELAAAVDDSAAELIVHTPPDGVHDRKPWIISDGPAAAPNLRPTHFPFDLRLGGETVRATAAEPLAWDEFGRVETDTWGDADSGHTWSEVAGDPTDRSVDGAAGVITLQASASSIRFQQILEDVADAEVLVRMAAQQISTGGSIIPGILLRAAGSDYYRARLHFSTSGTMFVSIASRTDTIGSSLSIPYTYGVGDWFWVRARVIGHRVLIRAWPESADSEPQIWHNDQTIDTNPSDSGAIGLTCSAFGSNTNTDPDIHYDDFQVITPQRITATRSINTVTKAHSAGAAVSLAQPARLAL